MEEDRRVIIVGGGSSGMAEAACLNKLSIPNIVLEREDCLASLWKKKAYDRLHLHLNKQVCTLPHMPFPDDYPKYVPRDLFVRYLDNYASRFHIHPLYHRSVESSTYDPVSQRWRVAVTVAAASESQGRDRDRERDREEFVGRFLVAATGVSSDAFVPEVEGLESFTGTVIHSTHFKSGSHFARKTVLVVGSGNSGMEIAFDLSNYGANTSIAVRSPMHIVSKEMTDWTGWLRKYLSADKVEWLLVAASRLWYGDLSSYGIRRPPEGPLTMMRKYGKYPIIDVGTIRKIKSREIQVLPAVKSIRGSQVVFDNGTSHPFDVIIFATGFKRSTKKWLKDDDGLLNEEGLVDPTTANHWKGKNGVYFVGLARRGFYGAAAESQCVAQDINTILGSTPECIKNQ